METRENILRQALAKNAVEVERWEKYIQENETAIGNMEKFSKHLEVEVMVPIGTKALVPGTLIHTNEVFVAHFQGYFSKCSAHKAAEICELRVKMAKEQLQKLATEANWWQDKLDIPHLEGALPAAFSEQREIIEDYDEQKEKTWRKKHRLRQRQAKLAERREREELQQRSKAEPSDAEVFQMLEEAELLEELEKELDGLEIDDMNDETLRRLLQGDLHLPPVKPRIAHDAQRGEVVPSVRQGMVLKKSHQPRALSTNNNSQPNPELLGNAAEENEEDSEAEELPEEVRLIKDQAVFLPPADRVGFYEYHIEIIRQKLKKMSIHKEEDLEAKINYITALEHLDELLETTEEVFIAENEEAQQQLQMELTNTANKQELPGPPEDLVVPEVQLPAKTQKRRISFALENQTMEFRKNEAVTEMLPKAEAKHKRDVIKLDDDALPSWPINTEPVKTALTPEEKQRQILEKVLQNRSFVSEQQSTKVFDMVNQILESSTGSANTLHIEFKHSEQLPKRPLSQGEEEMPGTPADLYRNYLNLLGAQESQQPKTVFLNGYTGEEAVKTPTLREEDRTLVYEDPRKEFSTPGALTGKNAVAKSILRNKSSVAQEGHVANPNKNKNNSSKPNVKRENKKQTKEAASHEGSSMSAYNKVMNEVLEKPLEAPDPLPAEKFIDANAPKKRVSRFKQMRSGVQPK